MSLSAGRNIAAVVATLLLSLIPVRAIGKVVDRSLHVPPPYWLIGGEDLLKGVGGSRILQMEGAGAQSFTPRYDPRYMARIDPDLAGWPLSWKIWMDHPLSMTRWPQRGEDRLQFQLGLYRYGKKEFQRAAEAFREFLVKFEDSPLRSRALYWLGESQDGSGDRVEAKKTHLLLHAEDIDDDLRSAVLISLGWISQRTGNLDDALEYYRQFHGLFSQSRSVPLVTFRMGEVFYRMKKFRSAAEQFEKVAREFPGFPEHGVALFWWGESLRSGGSFARARERSEEYLSRYPAGRLADFSLYSVGWSYLGEGNYREAGGVFQRLVKRFPASFLADEAILLEGWSLHMAQNYEEAIRVLKDFMDRFPGSPLIPRARFLANLGTYFLIGDSQAGEDLDKRLVGETDEEFFGEEYLNDDRFLKGMSLVGLGRFAEAAGHFENLARESGQPDLENISLLWAGWSAFQAGDFPKAEELLDHYMRSPLGREEFAEALYWRAESMAAQNNHAEAALSFGKSLELYPEGPHADDALFGVAEAYYAQERWREAGNKFQSLIDTYGESSFAREAALLQADSLLREGSDERALELFRDYFERNPSGPGADKALYHVGSILFGQEHYEEAQQAFRQLLHEYPGSTWTGDARFKRAMGYYRQGRFGQAITAFKEVMKRDPLSERTPLAQLRMADSYYRLRKYPEAMEIYQLTVKMNPNSRFEAEAEYGICLIALAQGNFEEYMTKSMDFVRRHPEHSRAPTVLSQLGRQLLRKLRYQEASAIFAWLLKGYPGEHSSPDVLLAAALADRSGKSRREAMSELRKKLKDTEQEFLKVEYRFELANLHLETGNCKGALKEFEKIIDRNPDHPLAEYALFDSAGCHLRDGNLKETRKAYSRLITGNWGSQLLPGALYQWGSMLLDSGDYMKAEEVLKGISSGWGDELVAMAAFKLGRTLQKMDKKEEAYDQYIRARSLDPQGRFSLRSAFRAAEIARDLGRKRAAAGLYRSILQEGEEGVIGELAREGLQALGEKIDAEKDRKKSNRGSRE